MTGRNDWDRNDWDRTDRNDWDRNDWDRNDWDRNDWDRNDWDRNDWDRNDWDRNDWDRNDWDRNDWDRNDWDRPPPGFLEIDLVAHCGGPLSGSFIHSLVATGICTGWTEAVPLLAREQSLVVAGLEAIGQRLPFPIRGIDSDNDSVFINETLVQYCAGRGIEFTRSRAYRSNDQAWIEQKNGSVVRGFAGHGRYSGQVAGLTLAYLYEALHLYVNFFQPSFKLIDKTRDGATTVKRYSQPANPL